MRKTGVQSAFDWVESGGGSDSAVVPRLRDADVAHGQVSADWEAVVRSFWNSPDGLALSAFLQGRLADGAVVYPPQPLRALELTPLSAVKVVVLGQDPYHGPGQAEGLAFSVATGVRIPPSLRNVFQEVHRDLGVAPPVNGSLVRWARQGVLLLNTCLTVEDGLPASHAGRGWERLTEAIIQCCSDAEPSKVFLLWGAHAQKKASLIDERRHRVLCANHPSPLSARRGPVPFVGCGHFRAANQWLESHGQTPVMW